MSIPDINLHLAELTEKFNDSDTINIDEFHDFYSDVFGKINKKTLHWYIYELKKNGIIKNVSRGLYELARARDNTSDIYAVITMDIVNSTKTEDYKKFNNMLRNKTREINNAINTKYGTNRGYHISQGDELQILFPLSKTLGDVLLITLSYLYPFAVRYGISAGGIQDELRENSWEMNGPIFWNARDQLEKIKDSGKYSGLIKCGHNRTDRLCNNILPIINKTIGKITGKQWEAIRENYSESGFEAKLKKLNIGKSSYFDRLKTSNIDEILMCFQAIYEIIKAGEELN